MPKNKGKGGKSRKRGTMNTGDDAKRTLLFKEDLQEYAVVLRMLGDGRLEAQCYDDTLRTCICHIRGKMRKKVWINQGDHILVSLRDFQVGKADVIHKYNDNEVRELKALGELPEKLAGALNNLGGGTMEEETGFKFEISEI